MSQPLRARQIHPLALAQLTAWREYASKWYFMLELRHTDKGHRTPEIEQYHLVCVKCGRSITVMSSEGTGYLLSVERLLDEVTRHLRNVHRGLEDDVYYGRKDTQAGIDPRGSGPDNGSRTDTG